MCRAGIEVQGILEYDPQNVEVDHESWDHWTLGDYGFHDTDHGSIAILPMCSSRALGWDLLQGGRPSVGSGVSKRLKVVLTDLASACENV